MAAHSSFLDRTVHSTYTLDQHITQVDDMLFLKWNQYATTLEIQSIGFELFRPSLYLPHVRVTTNSILNIWQLCKTPGFYDPTHTMQRLIEVASKLKLERLHAAILKDTQ